MKYKVLKTRVVLSLSKAEARKLHTLCGNFIDDIEVSDVTHTWIKEYALAKKIRGIDFDTYSGKSLRRSE